MYVYIYTRTHTHTHIRLMQAQPLRSWLTPPRMRAYADVCGRMQTYAERGGRSRRRRRDTSV